MRFTHRIPRRLTFAATTLAVLGTCVSALAAQGATQDRRPVVAVLDYINASMRTDADYKALSKGISTVLAGRLGETDSIRIVDIDSPEFAKASPNRQGVLKQLMRQFIRECAADWISKCELTSKP